MEQILLFLAPMAEAYLGKYGVAVQIVTVLGSLKLLIEPMMDLLEAYVSITPSKTDDLLPAKIRSNKIYKMVIYVLNWLTSLKLKK